jgi:hypothetical protein
LIFLSFFSPRPCLLALTFPFQSQAFQCRRIAIAVAAGWSEIVDPGITDKRLMIVEPEFAGAISVLERSGNTLSPLIRRSWDGDKLATLTRSSPLTATEAHISIVGHITVDELRARISRTEMGNGFANRFLFVLVRRSKELPFGGNLTDSAILCLGERLKSAIDKAKMVGRRELSDDARAKWAEVYHDLSAAQPGLLGAVTARAEAQTIRLALIYALLDGAEKIDLSHLEAAVAVWEYCESSAAHIFGSLLGDPIADEILRALQVKPEGRSPCRSISRRLIMLYDRARPSSENSVCDESVDNPDYHDSR